MTKFEGWGKQTDPEDVRAEGDSAYRFFPNNPYTCPYADVERADLFREGWWEAKKRIEAYDRYLYGPIGELIDKVDASDDIKHILRRIAEAAGVDLDKGED